MEDFSNGKYVLIHDEKGVERDVYMLPFTVREYMSYLGEKEWLEKKYSRDDAEIKLTELLLIIIEKHVTKGFDGSLLLNELMDAFVALNFGKAVGTGKTSKIGTEILLTTAFDFLINQGHSHSEIKDYTLPEFIRYQEIACERLIKASGQGKTKKSGDPLKGIPVRN